MTKKESVGESVNRRQRTAAEKRPQVPAECHIVICYICVDYRNAHSKNYVSSFARRKQAKRTDHTSSLHHIKCKTIYSRKNWQQNQTQVHKRINVQLYMHLQQWLEFNLNWKMKVERWQWQAKQTTRNEIPQLAVPSKFEKHKYSSAILFAQNKYTKYLMQWRAQWAKHWIWIRIVKRELFVLESIKADGSLKAAPWQICDKSVTNTLQKRYRD